MRQQLQKRTQSGKAKPTDSDYDDLKAVALTEREEQQQVWSIFVLVDILKKCRPYLLEAKAMLKLPGKSEIPGTNLGIPGTNSIILCISQVQTL